MAEIDGLPPLQEVIKKYQLSAKKSLGQNFLLDLNITDKIARQAGKLQDRHVIEIGPGPGGLTRALLAQGAIVTVIEYDRRVQPALEEIAAHYPNRLKIIFSDALTYDWTQFAQTNVTAAKPKIIANLPYNIGTQLLLNWLCSAQWPPFYADMTLMFQKEVGERIIAPVGSSAYGRLAVFAAWRTESKICFDLPPQTFFPAPKVTSCIVHIQPKEKIIPCDMATLDLVTRCAFQQRRKMLRQSLKAIGGEELLKKANIDPTRRAETLQLEEFIALAHQINKNAN